MFSHRTATKRRKAALAFAVSLTMLAGGLSSCSDGSTDTSPAPIPKAENAEVVGKIIRSDIKRVTVKSSNGQNVDCFFVTEGDFIMSCVHAGD